MISINSNGTQIKAAYRKLVKLYHPDLMRGKSLEEKQQATEKLKEINLAYDIAIKQLDSSNNSYYQTQYQPKKEETTVKDEREMFREALRRAFPYLSPKEIETLITFYYEHKDEDDDMKKKYYKR